MINLISCLVFAKIAISSTYSTPYSQCHKPGKDICPTGQACLQLHYTGNQPFFAKGGPGYTSITYKQCLPVDYSESTMVYDGTLTTLTALRAKNAIFNSMNDDCGPVNGAFAGCGLGLQCIHFGAKYKCVPFVTSAFPPPEAQRYQTCGASTIQNLPCATSYRCASVKAIIKGVVTTNGKNICLASNELRKRVVREAKTYLYSLYSAI